MKQQAMIPIAGRMPALILLALLLAVAPVAATDYEYDDLGRVTRVTYDNGTTVEYEYDEAGNIIRMVSSGRDWRSVDDTLRHSNPRKKPKEWKPDEDVYEFVGTPGEVVTIRLEAEPREDGADKTAVLLLRDTKNEKKHYKRQKKNEEPQFGMIDDGVLPNEITVALPAAGPYYIAVSEGTYGEGYRLTLEARPETCASLVRVGGVN